MSTPSTAPIDAATPFETHTVENQARPLEDYNVFLGDKALVEAVVRDGGGWVQDRAAAFGAACGAAATVRDAELAERFTPQLRTHDRFGRRIDEVEFHPSYHTLMRLAFEAGIHALPWTERRPGAHVARAALYIPFNQTNDGPACPLTMTFASIPALRSTPEIAQAWEPRILASAYDPAALPVEQKRAATIGMAMTEKQGGSDVRANASRATALGNRGPGGAYAIVGHKWFCSAPMSDGFLVLAQAPGGLSCFLVPRWRPDGTRNAVHLQRLKNKLGNHANASSEVELHGAFGWLLGEEGRGVPTIIEMVRHTRLDCALGSTAVTRHAVAQAINHCRDRAAFGRKLIAQPLMTNVLADLAIESEAATMLSLRVARAFDEQDRDEAAARFARIVTPVAKYWICKRTPAVAYEALECHGGNGFVEESIMPRLFRDSPVNSVWEGSGNVQCLDLLRAVGRDPATLTSYFAEIETAKGTDSRLDRYVGALGKELSDLSNIETRARRLVERLALALQGALMVRHAPAFVAEAFLASRLDGDHGQAFGTLPPGIDTDAIVSRADPLAA
ncbi:acyl-CoA dehydrogenase family protein [Reyranella sp. CPCC 100927]|uniref:acyl-CoA dehydrogenase family protein n=1 Tax=Reyranella sp. CPCC 100927 TaxID=2599616 RepID=UPI0011B41C89|nr:acyl-CoA dehydrogenase family protein [Reyranella sp. CPCC 100927]TWT10164.1 DNA alkylation response protein [Reyranella sp. CPCC 100927]